MLADLEQPLSLGSENTAGQMMIILIQGPKYSSHPYSKYNRDTEAVRESLDLLLKSHSAKLYISERSWTSKGDFKWDQTLGSRNTCCSKQMQRVCAQGPVLAAQLSFGICIFCDHIWGTCLWKCSPRALFYSCLQW